MPRRKRPFKYDEMAVRLILWQNVQRLGFRIVAHEEDGSAIKFHFLNALDTAAGKQADTALNVAEFCLLLHNAYGRFVYRDVIRQ